MRRYLVVANRTLGGPELVAAVRERIAEGPCEFYVVVPAVSSLSFAQAYGVGVTAGLPALPLTEEQGVEQARERLAAEVDRIRREGAPASGEVGDPDPMRAIAAVLGVRAFDEIILATLPPGASRWLHLDLPSRVERRFATPLTHIVTSEPG